MKSSLDPERRDMQELLNDLKHSDWSKRAKAVYELKGYEDPVITDAIFYCLNDENENVWLSAVNVLKEKNDLRLVKHLIKTLSEDQRDEVRWHARTGETLASWGQKMIYHGPLKPFESALLRSPVVPWSYAASRVYHDVLWYPLVGNRRVEEALDAKWGRLFAGYGDMPPVTRPLYEPKTAVAAGLLGVAASALALLWLARRGKRRD